MDVVDISLCNSSDIFGSSTPVDQLIDFKGKTSRAVLMGRGWKRVALDTDTAPVPYPTDLS